MLNNVVICLLGDEDPRVRHVAAASLVRYICLFCFLKKKRSLERQTCYSVPVIKIIP